MRAVLFFTTPTAKKDILYCIIYYVIYIYISYYWKAGHGLNYPLLLQTTMMNDLLSLFVLSFWH